MAVNIVKLRKQARSLGIADVDELGRKELDKAIAKAQKSSNSETPQKKQKSRRSQTQPVAKKKKATAKKNSPAPAGNGDVGRALIGKIDYSITDGWNPRDGSPVSIIWKSLKKHRDNVEKVFDALKGQVNDLTKPRNPDGSKRSKAERLDGLRYRINRTRFEFATRTGQHQRGTKRVKYGKGEYAKASRKK